MDSGVIDGSRIFPAEAVALSHRLIARQTDEERRSFAFFQRDAWAAGWDLGSYAGEPMVSRFGAYSSTRSHLSFLPQRRIGVVTQVNGDLAFGATDIIAAFVYDLERGKPNARALAEERFQRLSARRPGAIADVVRRDSVIASRLPQRLRRPLSDYAGSYRHPSQGTITFEVRGKELHYRWGALSGVATGRDAAAMNNVLSDAYFKVAGRDALRILLFPTGGTTVEFKFSGSGPASSVEVREEVFTRQ
jgi:hypothetical protein